MTILKERRWEIMEVGEEFGPVQVTVDIALVRAYAFAVDDFTPSHLYPKTEDAPVMAHAALLCREARDIISTAYDIASGGAGMHTKHECYFFGCPTVGDTYTITGRHTEKYIKREKQYVVLESDVHDAAGKLLFRQRSTHIRALKPGVAKTAEPAAPGAGAEVEPERAVALTREQVATGVDLRPLTKRFAQEHLTVFAGTSWNNIHNDPELAKSSGLRGTVASGLQTMAAVAELMESYFGEGWTDGGSLAVAFIAPLYVDETITVGATITTITTDAVTADVWCETGTGVRVLAGSASARI